MNTQYLNASNLEIAEEGKKYIELAPIQDCIKIPLSSSGKAVRIEGRGTGQHFNGAEKHESFWVPVSVLRKSSDSQWGDSVVIPVWFVASNDLWRHFQ